MTDAIPMRLMLAAHPSTRALTEGALDTCPLAIEHMTVNPIHKAFKPMVRNQQFDACELAIVTAIQAVAYQKAIMLLPVTVASRFQHKCIVCDADRELLRPKDLPGKRVGVRAYTQTTGAWVRTILEREYGVASSSIDWVTIEKPHVAEYRDPPNVIQIESNNDLKTMLLKGEIDAAIFGNDMPQDDRLQPIIPNPDAAARRRFAQDGIIQINHIVALSKTFADRYPDGVRTLMRLFETAKPAHPLMEGEPDLCPIGFEAMRPSIEVLLSSAYEQKLVPEAMTFDRLFADGLALLAS